MEEVLLYMVANKRDWNLNDCQTGLHVLCNCLLIVYMAVRRVWFSLFSSFFNLSHCGHIHVLNHCLILLVKRNAYDIILLFLIYIIFLNISTEITF